MEDCRWPNSTLGVCLLRDLAEPVKTQFNTQLVVTQFPRTPFTRHQKVRCISEIRTIDAEGRKRLPLQAEITLRTRPPRSQNRYGPKYTIVVPAQSALRLRYEHVHIPATLPLRDLLLRRNMKVLSLLLCGVFWSALAPAWPQTGTGGAIRVESKEVLIPVIVLDKTRVTELQRMNRRVYWDQVLAGDLHLQQQLAVAGLSAKDFQVWEDGIQQSVETVASQTQNDSPIIRDNVGGYREFVGPGGGTWAIPLRGYGYFKVIELPDVAGYDIAFTPAPSPEGSCHKVKVTVNRPNSLIFARTNYCDPGRSAADPLRGTTLGRQLHSDLETNRPGDISIAAKAIPLFSNDGTPLLRVVLEYASGPESQPCSAKPPTVAILGLVYGEDGSVVAQFSDDVLRTYGHDVDAGLLWTPLLANLSNAPCPFYAPFRYETQIEIPAGIYQLRIGFRDGKKFGRANIEITLPNSDHDRLVISGIALSRRFRLHSMEPRDSPTTLPENHAPLVADGVEVTTTADTRFERGSAFCFFFQIYEPLLSVGPEPKVAAVMRIVDASTGKTVNTIKAIEADAHNGNPVVAVGRRIDINTLPSGSYRLEAQATDSTGASTPWRLVAFTLN